LVSNPVIGQRIPRIIPSTEWAVCNSPYFAARLAVRRADWIALAALFEQARLTDGDGKTAAAETARSAVPPNQPAQNIE
jgi:hypothetical protein